MQPHDEARAAWAGTVVLRDRVRLRITGRVGRLTLARPDAGNALDLPMAQALRDAASGAGRERRCARGPHGCGGECLLRGG